ncbi:HEAT repeat domain-containing protein [bacterium]|nr:HEAT repeat domain-containing protein [bacterium]
MSLFKRNKPKNGQTGETSDSKPSLPDLSGIAEEAYTFAVLTQKLIDDFQSHEASARQAAIDETVSLGPPIADDLIHLLSNWFDYGHADASTINLRISTALALGNLKDPRAIEPLIRMAQKIERTVSHRRAAAEALGMIGEAAYQSMVDLLRNEWESLQQLACWALGDIGNPAAVEHLIPMLSTAAPFHPSHIREAAAGSLKKLTGEDFGQDMEKWKEWYQSGS